LTKSADVRHLPDRQILFSGGKRGVGKTTCAAALALGASERGRRVLLVSTDPAHPTSDIFDRPLGHDEREIRSRLAAGSGQRATSSEQRAMSDE
jgi:arsenite-transporting ATPase